MPDLTLCRLIAFSALIFAACLCIDAVVTPAWLDVLLGVIVGVLAELALEVFGLRQLVSDLRKAYRDREHN